MVNLYGNKYKEEAKSYTVVIVLTTKIKLYQYINRKRIISSTIDESFYQFHEFVWRSHVMLAALGKWSYLSKFMSKTGLILTELRTDFFVYCMVHGINFGRNILVSDTVRVLLVK